MAVHMYRCASGYLGSPLSRNHLVAIHARVVSRCLSSAHENCETNYAAARTWAAELNRDTIPKGIARVRFDRSSGKGGQHVNTTSSKATCTWPLDSLLAHVPEILHSTLRASRYYVASSNSLQMSSQLNRSAHKNEEDCYEKMYMFLQDISKQAIPGETSFGQKKKVEQLQKSENASRLQMKKQQSVKKQSRRGKESDY